MAQHYFDQEPDTPDVRRDISASIWGTEFTFTTSTGVFSNDGLDKATAILLKNTPPPSAGTVLDIGCGWGPISCALAHAGSTVWAVDVNQRALDLTRTNATRHGLHVTACQPHEVPDDVEFDEIWSNPPIRIGKEALHDLLLTWLPRLKPGGIAHLVVGKNLGADSLQRWLIGNGWPTVRASSDKGFRILQVTRPIAP